MRRIVEHPELAAAPEVAAFIEADNLSSALSASPGRPAGGAERGGLFGFMSPTFTTNPIAKRCAAAGPRWARDVPMPQR